MKLINKLIVITRRDLTYGYQAVQAGHAAIQFQHDYPEIARSWYNESNYLIYLVTTDEASLLELIGKATIKGIKVSIFKEPDIDNQITAIALEPSDQSKRLTSSLPLAFKNKTESI